MSNNDVAYNNGQDIPIIISKILEFLIENGNENFWKAIKYPDYDCLSKPNLTLQEKRDLIYTNGKNLNDFNIYANMPLISPEEDKAKTLLKVYKIRTKPIDRMNFIISINFDIITHTALSNIGRDNDMLSRIDYIESELIEMLHEKDFYFGRVQFDRGISADAEAYLAYNNSNNYFGQCLCLTVRNTRTDEENICYGRY